MGIALYASYRNIVILGALLLLLPGCFHSMRRGPLELDGIASVLGRELPPPAGTYSRKFPGPCSSEMHNDWDGAADEIRRYSYNDDGSIFNKEHKRMEQEQVEQKEWWRYQYESGRKKQWSYGCINFSGGWTCSPTRTAHVFRDLLTRRIKQERSMVPKGKGFVVWLDEYVYGPNGLVEKIILLRPDSKGKMVHKGTRTYFYDKKKRVVREENDDKLGGVVEWTFRYKYDEKGQVIEETLEIDESFQLYRQVRTYDEHGNLVLEEQYNSRNALYHVRLFSYECWE